MKHQNENEVLVNTSGVRNVTKIIYFTLQKGR